MPGLDLARVLETYGADVLTLGGWLTRDGFMPHRLFQLLARALPALNAARVLAGADAAAIGGGADKNGTEIERLKHLAFPENY